MRLPSNALARARSGRRGGRTGRRYEANQLSDASWIRWGKAPIDVSAGLADAAAMTRLMIFVQHPRHLSIGEAESWLEKQVDALVAEGLEHVRLERVNDASRGLGHCSGWKFELDCRDADAVREVVRGAAGRALLTDLRLLGMKPSVELVEERD